MSQQRIEELEQQAQAQGGLNEAEQAEYAALTADEPPQTPPSKPSMNRKMQREILHFNDEQTWLQARAIDITSTESASLYGFGRETAFELACRKDGKTESRFKPSERTEIGKEIEAAIAIRAARIYGIQIRHKNEYMRVHEWRMGSSFDYEVVGVASGIVDDNRLRQAFGSMGPGLLEVKNVDSLVYRNEWCAGEEPEAPAHIEIQLQHQLEISELQWGCIVVFVGGNHIEIILRLRDAKVGAALRKKIVRFWDDLSKKIYPPIELPEDLGVLKLLYSHAEPGKILSIHDLDEDRQTDLRALLTEYSVAAKDEKGAKDRKDTAQGRILQIIGDAEKVITDEYTVSCGTVAPTFIEAYERKGYRYWKVTPKKAKATA